MAIPHAKSGEVIDVRPTGNDKITTTLLKTDSVEVIRLVLPAGKIIPEHDVAGEITVQCLTGRVLFKSGGESRELTAGHLCFLTGGEPHAVEALEASCLLVTILFTNALP